jgi:hypothetical protein
MEQVGAPTGHAVHKHGKVAVVDVGAITNHILDLIQQGHAARLDAQHLKRNHTRHSTTPGDHSSNTGTYTNNVLELVRGAYDTAATTADQRTVKNGKVPKAQQSANPQP